MKKREAVIVAICREYNEASAIHGKFHSVHEGYAVILEEMDELWDEVKKKAINRDGKKMAKEAVQVGAMALRFLEDLCKEEDICSEE